MDSLQLLKSMCPRLPNQKNSAVTGPIDIDVFTTYEEFFRQHMRAEGLRAIYRGPRLSNNSKKSSKSTTRRQDAEYVLLYHKN